MLKKFVSSFLAMMLLFGCGSKSDGTPAPKDPTASVQTIIKELQLENNVDEVADRIIPGLFFFEEDTVTDYKFYAADQLADCVGVFTTSDPESTVKSVREYLATRKALLENYAPGEVFKVDNAVILSNENTVIMIVCEDLNSAKTTAEKILGN